MARPRTSATELAKLLDAADQPVYVLDEDHRIVFCSRACLEWTGTKPEELLGKRCTYSSGAEATGVEAVAAGLCPPPSAWACGPSAGIVAITTPDGRLARRRAHFFPLRDSQQRTLALAAVVDPADLSDAEASGAALADNEAALLHERLRAWHRHASARHGLDRLVGQSPAMHRVRARVELAAGVRASVLIVGPPGSGRQHVAGTIHHAGAHAPPGPLIPLACSLLGAEMIHSTVLALATKGPLEGATGQGTLLLNDADQIPLEAQEGLTAALASKRFPLRLIATARRGLEELAGEGAYRADLAALLSTIVIELPPLAQRRADLPLLAQRFLEDINARGAKQLAGFTSEAMDLLAAYGWPGNADELAMAVAEAHRRAEGPYVGPNDLPERIHWAADAAAHPRRVETTIVLDEFLRRVERELLCRALGRARGNKSKAAKLLGMTRPRLYRRMVQLGLVEEGRGTRDEGRGARDEGRGARDEGRGTRDEKRKGPDA